MYIYVFVRIKHGMHLYRDFFQNFDIFNIITKKLLLISLFTLNIFKKSRKEAFLPVRFKQLFHKLQRKESFFKVVGPS